MDIAFAIPFFSEGVIPKGSWRIGSDISLGGESSRRFSQQGMYETNGLLRRNIVPQDFLRGGGASAQSMQQLISTLNDIEPNLGNTLFVSQLAHETAEETRAVSLQLEYGLTSLLTLAVQSQILQQEVRSKLTVNSTNRAGDIADRLAKNTSGMETLVSGLENIRNLDDAFFAERLFRANGYDVPTDFSRTGFSATEIELRARLVKTDRLNHIVALGVRVPSGRDGQLENLLDHGTPRNVWGVTAKAYQGIVLGSRWQLNLAAKTTFHMQKTKKIAVPSEPSDIFPSILPEADQVRDVALTVGSLLESEIAVQYSVIPSRVYLWSGYRYDTKGSDSFSGSGDLFYNGLADRTDYTRGQLLLGAGAAFADFFASGKTVEFMLEVERDVKGKNILQETNANLSLRILL